MLLAASGELPVVHYLDGAWTDILGCAFVLAGLAAFASVVVLLEGRRRHRSRAGMPTRLEPGREWELVMGRATKELARGPRVEVLQADATVTVEAAEYAFNRMLQDYARHCTAPSAPADAAPVVTFTPEPVQDTEEAPAEERAPLAA